MLILTNSNIPLTTVVILFGSLKIKIVVTLSTYTNNNLILYKANNNNNNIIIQLFMVYYFSTNE